MENVRKVKTAVVGCGMISNIYIHNLKDLFYIIDLQAVCDIDPAAAKSKAETYGVDRVMTLDEIVASDEIELVVTLTWPTAHYEVIKRLLEAGKHVFTEKPLAPELWQAEELVKLADEKGLYLGVAPDSFLGAGMQTARKILDAGLIGNVTSCLVSVNRDQSLNGELFRFLRNPGGAFPQDVGIYYIMTLLSMLGPVRSIRGFAAPAQPHDAQFWYVNQPSEQWTVHGNNLIAGSVQFASGVLGSIHFNGNTVNQTKNVFMLFGTEGILELGDPNSFGGGVRLIRPESGACDIPATHGYDGKPVWENPSMFDLSYGHRGIGVAEMAWAIRRGRPNRCSKELGLHALEVLCGMDEAARTGQEYVMRSTFAKIPPLKSGYMSSALNGGMRGDAEMSLVD